MSKGVAFSYTVLLVLGAMLIAVLFLSKPIFMVSEYNTTADELLNKVEEELIVYSSTSFALRKVEEEVYLNEINRICSDELSSKTLTLYYEPLLRNYIKEYVEHMKPVMVSLKERFGDSIGIKFDPDNILLDRVSTTILYNKTNRANIYLCSIIVPGDLVVNMYFGKDEQFHGVYINPESDLVFGSMAVGDIVLNFTLDPSPMTGTLGFGFDNIGVKSVEVYQVIEQGDNLEEELIAAKVRVTGARVAIEIPVDLLVVLNGDSIKYRILVEYYNGLPVQILAAVSTTSTTG